MANKKKEIDTKSDEEIQEDKSVKDEMKEEIAKALKEQKEKLELEEKNRKKKKRKIIRWSIFTLLFIAIIVFILFFLKFKVTFKYNNGKDDKEISVKFLRMIPVSEVEQDVTLEGYNFLGWFETYYLNGEQIETIKKDSHKEESICKKGFKLSSEKVKCIAENKFDFENTKIFMKKTIEALWSKDAPAPVEEPAPTPTPAPAPTPAPRRDEGTISLSTSNACLIAGSSTTVTASVNNALDSTINWSNDSCLTLSGSGNSRTVTGSNCGANPGVTGSLNNGASNSIVLTYENGLTVSVTNPNGSAVELYNGIYYGNSLTITTNVPAYITGKYLSGDGNSLRTSATTQGAASTTVTIKTPCGQTKTLSITAIIN